MAVTFSSLESSISTVGASSYTTGSVTPTRVTYLFVDNRIAVGVSGGPQQPTVTGGGLTWSIVQTKTGYNGAGTPNRRVTLLKGVGVPSTGTLTITLNSETQTHCGWQIIGVTATVDPVIIQSAGADDGGVLGTTGTVTLPGSISNAVNVTLACIMVTSAPISLTVGSGFAAIGAGYAETTDGTSAKAESKTNTTTATATWTGNNSWVMVAAEIQDGASRVCSASPNNGGVSPRPAAFRPGNAR